ncbi:phosphotransferase [Kineococcus indalonis]|uniref:phosphotransferase n=1 Tax=Kineococcus indalonis TaxID=2696566 RepID=UPI001412C314|nr:phosphotransferase [Kineococcus indalonis]NAZ84778.1 phosphotransferase [Kineococcus indalonis]
MGGTSGQTWACGEHVLRIGDPDVLDRERAAMAAAAGVVPVPQVLQRARYVDAQGRARAASLLTRLPGRPAGDVRGLSSRQVRRRGEACGAVQLALAVVAPAPVVADAPNSALARAARQRGLAGADSLLHLDLHPLNVLVDDAGEVSGVVDWANTAVGPAVLDRARTWSILTLDPAVLARRDEPRVAAMVQGWSDAAGFEALPAPARAWACRFMLDDLAARHPGDGLAHVRRCLHANTGTGP